jgi:aspartate/methionine/tyrosine aminotransferase
MSKVYGMPGVRVGWVACQDRELLASISESKHYLSICNSAPGEILGVYLK